MRPHVEATWGWDDADQLRRFGEAFDPAQLQIVELDGAPIGALRVDFADLPVRLLNIQLSPPHQRKGYGAVLIRRVATQAGCRPVWLQVLKVNPARALYERLGFVVIGETATHWQMMHPGPDRG